MIFKINVRINHKTRDCGTFEWNVSMFKCVYMQPCVRLMVHACVFVHTGSLAVRVQPFVDDAYVFVRESADFSDLGRLLSCWKHTAAHQIFTAPSNSRLHGPSSTGLGAAGLSERGEKHISTQVQEALQTPGKVTCTVAEGLNHTGSWWNMADKWHFFFK